MKRLQSITIKNFKAFQDAQPIDLNGRNLLLYGPNGSGKSSIYWALYTFLQSSHKQKDQVVKYFDHSHQESLRNVHVSSDALASITVVAKGDEEGSLDEPYEISLAKHETVTPDIQKATLASDFINYRVLFRFYHFSNSEEIDLWPVFEREVLAFCPSPLLGNLGAAWQKLSSGDPYETNRQQGLRGPNAKKTYVAWYADRDIFNKALEEAVETISSSAQKFYNHHFHRKTDPQLELRIAVIVKADYDRDSHHIQRPRIGLAIKIGPTPIRRPQVFLNEARLTQIALAIRLGATKAHLRESPIKLMVLDDLLISLDMANRMQVIEIVLNDKDFGDFQKVIMTHDRAFYSEIRRRIGSSHQSWLFLQMHRRDVSSPIISTHEDPVHRAEDMLKDGRFDEAGHLLRTSAEDTLRTFSQNYPDTGEFRSLSTLLKQAHSNLEGHSLRNLVKLLDASGLDENTLRLLVPDNMADLLSNRSLTDEQRKACLSQRTALRKLLRELHSERRRAMSVLDQIDNTKDRILNPSSHAGDPPLYGAEVAEAVELVKWIRDNLSRASGSSVTPSTADKAHVLRALIAVLTGRLKALKEITP